VRIEVFRQTTSGWNETALNTFRFKLMILIYRVKVTILFKKTYAFLVASKEIGLEVNSEINKYIGKGM